MLYEVITDGRLNIVANDACATRLHRTSIRIGQGNLFVGRLIELDFDVLEHFHLLFQSGDFVLP